MREGSAFEMDELPQEIQAFLRQVITDKIAPPPFMQPCNRSIDATFCGPHGSVWPDTVGTEECLFITVMRASSHFAHAANVETVGGLIGAAAAWLLAHNMEKE